MRLHFKRLMNWAIIWCIILLLNYLNFSKLSTWVFFKYFQSSADTKTELYNRSVSYSKHLTLSAESQVTTLEAKLLPLWPSKEYYSDDRIVNQLKFKLDSGNVNDIKLKKIYAHSGFGGRRVGVGRTVFLEDKCLVNSCEVIRNPHLADSADALIFLSVPNQAIKRSSPDQIWIIYILESPYHSAGLRAANDIFNWTATYRHDSDIVAPYEKFVRFNESVQFLPKTKNYADGKTKKVAWFVSNCGAKNTRLQYARELAKHISVDIYGGCGHLKCPRREKRCFDLLNTDYKFYLSFENSNCRDYVTEKFFVTGLQHDVIPIVMGAAPEDYARAAPPHSFIHVDDFQSPKDLAEYLHKLDQNDDLYNEYFQWKGTGTFINTYFWCRVCAMLHDTSRGPHVYRDLEKWWRGEEICIGKDTWRKRQRTSKYIVEDNLM